MGKTCCAAFRGVIKSFVLGEALGMIRMLTSAPSEGTDIALSECYVRLLCNMSCKRTWRSLQIRAKDPLQPTGSDQYDTGHFSKGLCESRVFGDERSRAPQISKHFINQGTIARTGKFTALD